MPILMKSTQKTSLRDVVSSREAIALATLFSVAGASAAEAPKKDEEKKKPSENGSLDEINVTAERGSAYNPQRVQSPKITAPLVDTPQTISVVPKEVFTQQAAQSLNDVLKNTPGITFIAGENGFAASGNSMVMRGFDATSNIFVDGVRDNGNYGREIYNTEQVEISKGPAGDNGRGSAGGYINLATKSPQLTDFYTGTTAYRFDETRANGNVRTTFDINKTVGESTLQGAAFRVNALLQEGGVTGRDYAENNVWGIAPSFALGLGTDTRFILSYEHLVFNKIPDMGFPGAAVPGTSTNATWTGGHIRRDNYYGTLEDFDDVVSDVAMLRIEHDFSDTMRISNQTRFNRNERDAIYVVPGAPNAGTGLITTNRQAFDRETTTYSNLTNFSAEFKTGFVEHSFAGGLELTREEGTTLRDWSGLGQGTPIGGNITTGVYNPDPGRPIYNVNPAHAWEDDVRINTAAIYANDTLKFSEQWQATIGTRLEHYRAKVRFHQVATGRDVNYEADDTLFTGKIGVNYKPAKNGSIYAAYGVAAQPPGTSYLSNDNGSRNSGGPQDPNAPGGTVGGNNSPNSDPQYSYNYEIGTKWQWFDDRLITSLAVFRTERDNISTSTNPDGTPASYGDQVVKGVELGIAGNITENWAVFGGLSYLESENHNDQSVTADNAELPFTPDWTANLWTTYRFPIGLTIGGGVRYVAESVASGGPNNTTLGVLPSYTVFDAMIAYEINENVTVRFNVNNIGDEYYARAINNNSGRAYLGEPRSYTLSADWKF